MSPVRYEIPFRKVLLNQDLVLKIIQYIDYDLISLLKRVNKCFWSAISTFVEAGTLFTSHIKPYCTSVMLLSWALDEGGCSAEWCRNSVSLYASEVGHADVLQWCKDRDFINSCAECMVRAVAAGNISTIAWLRHNSPSECSDSVIARIAVEQMQAKVLRWLKNLDGCATYTPEMFVSDTKTMHLSQVDTWLRTGNFTPLLDDMHLFLADELLKEEDVEVLVFGFTILQEWVQTDGVSLTKSDIQAIIALVAQVVGMENGNATLQNEAIETLNNTIEHRPKLIQKLKIIEPMLQQSVDILGSYDGFVWSFEEENNDEWHALRNGATKMAFLQLDVLASSISLNVLMKPTRQLLKRSWQSSDPKQRKGGCALVIAMAEGCADAFSLELETLVPVLNNIAIHDADVDVRCYAMYAIAQLCEFCQPSILHHHEVIFTTVEAVFSFPTVNSMEQTLCCGILEHLCEPLDAPAVLPHLQILVDHLLPLLENKEKMVAETMLVALSAIALGVGEHFQPYVEGIVDKLQGKLFSMEPDQMSLRGRALEFLGRMGTAIGKNHFSKYFDMGLQATLHGLTQCPCHFWLHEHCYLYVGNAATVMGFDMDASQLSELVPILQRGMHVDTVKNEEEAEECYEFKDKEGAGKAQAAAVAALQALSANTESLFVPHIPETLRAADDIVALGCTMEAQIQVWKLFASCLICLHGHCQFVSSEHSPALHVEVIEVARFVVPALLGSMMYNEEERAASAAATALREITVKLGTPFLNCDTGRQHNPITYGEQLLYTATCVLTEETRCQLSGQHEPTDEDEESDAGGRTEPEDDTGEAGGDDSREKSSIICVAIELISAIASVLKEKFLDKFETLQLLILKFTSPNRMVFVRSIAIGNFGEILHFIGPAAMGCIDTLLPILEEGMDNTSEQIRRNTAYCLGIVIQLLSPGLLSFYASTFFKWIKPYCRHRIQAGRTNQGGADVDNVLAALAHLLDAYDGSDVPRSTSLKMLLNALPLREDLEEGLSVYTVIVKLIKREIPVCLKLLPEILDSFRQVLSEDSPYADNVAVLVSDCVNYMKESKYYEGYVEELFAEGVSDDEKEGSVE